ncbi:MAG: 30S ribosome-binding factor RbfA [Thermotogae bacterium]|nr:30S ribosome-binding factor RbfA [Thermotogota bacterium]
MKTHRLERIEANIKRLVAEVLSRKMKDPRITMTSVTRVELSKDKKYAKVYVSFLADEEKKNEIMLLLNEHAKGFIRTYLSQHLHMYVTPELKFVFDKGIEGSIKMQKILSEIEEKDAGNTSDR